MIKHILFRTIWKDEDRQSQEMHYKLKGPQVIINLLAPLSWTWIWSLALAPPIVVLFFAGDKLPKDILITIYCFAFASLASFIIANWKFRGPMTFFSGFLAERIYYLLYTKKGKALELEDLKALHEKEYLIFVHMATGRCAGYCYSVCYTILQTLKKGEMRFVAVKWFSPHEEKENYTMHVLYVNNGWAFDTFSARQYPLDKIYKFYDAKDYKTFSYEDIGDKDYNDFRKENWPEAYDWAKNNDCHINWKVEGDDENDTGETENTVQPKAS